MSQRVRKNIDCGKVRYVHNFIAPMFGNHAPRRKRSSETCPAVKKCNDDHNIDYVNAVLTMNFTVHDWHIALTYSDECADRLDEERVLKDRRNFITKLRRRCQKLGIELKYLTMTEQGVRSKRWHHHFVLPKEIPIPLLYECWGFGHIRILNTLYESPDDFRGLAKYYVDKSKGGTKEDDRLKGQHRYSFSRNCEKPEVTYETGLAASWRSVPIPPDGWTVKPGSLFNGIDELSGYPFQKYTLVRVPDECMPVRGKLTETQKMEIFSDKQKKVSQKETAQRLGISTRTVRRILQEFKSRKE